MKIFLGAIHYIPASNLAAPGHPRIGYTLNIPTWTKPALNGAVVGALAMAVIGFTWGGWVTGGTSRKNSATETSSGVATALTPYCIEKSKTDPLPLQS